MRWLIVLIYIAVTTGAIVSALPVFLLVILIGSMGGGLYMAGAILVMAAYIASVVYGRKGFKIIFLREINNKLANLKESTNFIPVLSVTTSDKMAFLGLDTFSNTGVFLNYPQDQVQLFKFSDILGCNWKDDDKTALFEITLKEGKVKIGIPSDQFGDFKTRMFAITGMNG